MKNKNSSFIKGTVKWSSLIIIKLPFLSKNMSEIFPLPLPRKTCALPFDFAWERPKKYFLLSAWHRELYGDINIYTLNLLVCNSGQYTYVTGLCNFFFVLQDLIDRTDSYFQRIAFQTTCFLLTSNTLRHKFFSSVNKKPLHWNGAV